MFTQWTPQESYFLLYFHWGESQMNFHSKYSKLKIMMQNWKSSIWETYVKCYNIFYQSSLIYQIQLCLKNLDIATEFSVQVSSRRLRRIWFLFVVFSLFLQISHHDQTRIFQNRVKSLSFGINELIKKYI